MSHTYDEHFMDYTGESSRHSAEVITGLLQPLLKVSSVLDVGCATGTWLRAWQSAGVGDIMGVDGDYVSRERLRIEPSRFQSADLSGALSLGRRFDLVQSLEVAEHIAAANADRFVRNLVEHSDGLVLFSAAPPGQGGEFHVNEQPLSYWRERFASHGYHPFDPVRPAISADMAVSFWYRYNVLLYVREDRVDDMPPVIRSTAIPSGQPIPDPTPLAFRMRKALVRLLPYPVQHRLARLKARINSRAD